MTQTTYDFITVNGWEPTGDGHGAMEWVSFHVRPEFNEGSHPSKEQVQGARYVLGRLALGWELEWLLLYCEQCNIDVTVRDMFQRGAKILSGEDSNPQSAERFVEEMHQLSEQFAQAKKANPDTCKETWSQYLFFDFNWNSEFFAGGKFDIDYWKKWKDVDAGFKRAIFKCVLSLYTEKAEPVVSSYKSAVSESDSRIALPWQNENLVGFYRLLLGAIAYDKIYKTFPFLLPDGVECEVDSGKNFDILRTDDQPREIADEIHAVFTYDVGERMKSFLWPTHQPTYLLPGYAK